jgi:hypothetical protein
LQEPAVIRALFCKQSAWSTPPLSSSCSDLAQDFAFT